MKSFLLALLLAPLLAPFAPLQDDQDAPDPSPVDTKRRFHMGTSDVFKKIELEEVSVDGGFIFYIQKAYGQNTGYQNRVVQTHLPWLKAAETAFEQVLGGTGGIDIDSGREPIAIVILNSHGDFGNYLAKAQDVRCHFNFSAAYHVSHSTLTLANLAAASETPIEVRQRNFVHGVVHALWQAYSHHSGSLPGPAWLTEGSAEYIAAAFKKDADQFESGAGLEKYVEWATWACTADGFDQEWLVPVKQMLVEHGGLEFSKRQSAQIKSGGDDEYKRAVRIRMSVLPLLFQLFYEDPSLLPSLASFVPHAMKGASDMKAIEDALGEVDVDTIAMRFWRNQFIAAKAQVSDFNLNRINGPESVLAASQAAAQTTSDSPDGADGSNDQVNVFPPTWDQAQVHAHAIYLASMGHFQGASDLLSKQSAPSLESAASLEQIQGFIDLRLQFLEDLVAKQSRLKLIQNGKKVSAKLVSIENGVLHFQPGKRALDDLAIDDLPLTDFASQVARARPPLGSDEQRATLNALLDAKRWDRTLAKQLGADSPVIKTIAARAQLKSDGAVVALIDQLHQLHAAKPKDALAIKALVRSLGASNSNHKWVATNKTSIVAIARQAFIEGATDKEFAASFNATEANLDGDILRLKYDFENKDQLLDFFVDDEAAILERFAGTRTAVPNGKRFLEIEDGEMSARGVHTARHCVPFLPPISLTYSSISYYDEEAIKKGSLNAVAIGLCDDLRETNLICNNYPVWVLVNDHGKPKLSSIPDSGSMRYDTEYDTEIELADGIFSSSSDVSYPHEVAVKTKLRGYTHLIFDTVSTSAFTEFEIEGRIDEAARAELARRMANTELTALGLL